MVLSRWIPLKARSRPCLKTAGERHEIFAPRGEGIERHTALPAHFARPMGHVRRDAVDLARPKHPPLAVDLEFHLAFQHGAHLFVGMRVHRCDGVRSKRDEAQRDAGAGDGANLDTRHRCDRRHVVH